MVEIAEMVSISYIPGYGTKGFNGLLNYTLHTFYFQDFKHSGNFRPRKSYITKGIHQLGFKIVFSENTLAINKRFWIWWKYGQTFMGFKSNPLQKREILCLREFIFRFWFSSKSNLRFRLHIHISMLQGSIFFCYLVS